MRTTIRALPEAISALGLIVFAFWLRCYLQAIFRTFHIVKLVVKIYFAFSGCIHSDNGYVETFDFGLYLFSNPVDEPREAVMASVENNSMNACS